MTEPPPLPDSNVPAELLGLPTESSLADARRAYARLIKIYRPDRRPEEFKRIQVAYEQLTGGAFLVVDRAGDRWGSPARPELPESPGSEASPNEVDARQASPGSERLDAVITLIATGDVGAIEQALRDGAVDGVPLGHVMDALEPDAAKALLVSPGLGWRHLRGDHETADPLLRAAVQLRLDEGDAERIAMLFDATWQEDAREVPAIAALGWVALGATAAHDAPPLDLAERVRATPVHASNAALVERVERELRCAEALAAVGRRLPAGVRRLVVAMYLQPHAQRVMAVERLATLLAHPGNALAEVDLLCADAPEVAAALVARFGTAVPRHRRELPALPELSLGRLSEAAGFSRMNLHATGGGDWLWFLGAAGVVGIAVVTYIVSQWGPPWLTILTLFGMVVAVAVLITTRAIPYGPRVREHYARAVLEAGTTIEPLVAMLRHEPERHRSGHDAAIERDHALGVLAVLGAWVTAVGHEWLDEE